MSKPIGIMLDPDAVRLLVRQGDGDVLREVLWSPDAPEAMVDALRAHVVSPSAIVVIVGLGFLEVAAPDLPPLEASAKQAMLWRDADRYFPIAEPAAVVCTNGIALAIPASRLEGWIRALRALAPVRAVISSPQAYARVLGSGAAQLAAGLGEAGVVRAEGGAVRSVRRTPAPRDGDSSPAEHTTTVGAKDVLINATSWLDAPPSDQVLNFALALTIRRDAQRRWATSAVWAFGAVALLLFAADRARSSQLTALQQRVEQLSERSKPAVRAETRRSRAQAELAMLAQANARQSAADSPLAVLAQLTRILPRDAFVQRLEFDGQQWRVDGTADNAPRLVPLLDGNARFRDVRIAAPSQRFLDVGRQRESFAISFRMRIADGGASGTP